VLLELGAAGLLREGDNSGDWTSFCRELRATRQDTELTREIRLRLQREDEVYRLLQLGLGRLRSAYAKELVENAREGDGDGARDKSVLAAYKKKFY
jgi:hypothetical protein